MPLLFQYQARAEALPPVAATPDRWQPTCPQPSRRVAAIAGLVAGVVAPVFVPTPTGWGATPSQPAAVVAPRTVGSQTVGPVFVPPGPQVVPFGWSPQASQPISTLPVRPWTPYSVMPVLVGTTPPPTLPLDLAGAIKAAFLASPGLSSLAPGGIFNGVAEDGSDTRAAPFVVFKINSEPMDYISSTSQWRASRVRFDCQSGSAVASNAMAQAVVDCFSPRDGSGVPQGVNLQFQDGATSPFVLVDASQAPATGRGKNNARVFRSSVDYSARTRLGRP